MERIPLVEDIQNYAQNIVDTGLLPSRNRDVLGTGLSWGELFQGGTNQETVVEVFYKAHITPRV